MVTLSILDRNHGGQRLGHILRHAADRSNAEDVLSSRPRGLSETFALEVVSMEFEGVGRGWISRYVGVMSLVMPDAMISSEAVGKSR